MIEIFVLDIPEFKPLVDAVAKNGNCRVLPPAQGYWRLQADGQLTLSRRALGLGPALWNSALSGGFRGRILQYGRDEMKLESESA